MTRHATTAVRWLAAGVSHLFYRIDRLGEVPRDGALLLLPNHPNALLDPALVWATAGRDVRFLAKSTLFDGALRPLLRAARAVPVYRRIDDGSDVTRNVETFAEVSAALAAGDAVCLFPEGISHSTGRLEPLRTGAARMALEAERAGTGVALVAVGLNFDRKTTFRSRVTVVFGPPFTCRDLLQAAEADHSAAVRALTASIAHHIRRLLVEADPLADAALVDRVDRLYAAARDRPPDPQDRLARRRAIASGIDRLRRNAPDRYEQLLLRFRRYDERLRRFSLRDAHLDWNISMREAARFAAREGALGLVLVPLCIVGLVVFAVPYHLTAVISRRAAPQREVVATAQVITGGIVYGAWLAGLVTAAWWLGGRPFAVAVAILIPLLAVVSLFAIERETAVLDAVRSWMLLRRARADTRERLRRHRSELADILDDAHGWLSEGEAGAPDSGRMAGV